MTLNFARPLHGKTVGAISVLMLGLTLLTVGYLLFKNQAARLAQDESKLVKQLRAIEESNRQLSGNLARLKSPLGIKQQIRFRNLPLIQMTELETHVMDGKSESSSLMPDWNVRVAEATENPTQENL